MDLEHEKLWIFWLCVLNKLLSWFLPMHLVHLLASDIPDRLIATGSYAGAWSSWESHRCAWLYYAACLKDSVITWSLPKAGMEIKTNVLDLLVIKPGIKKNVAFFQVSFILGMPHRYKPGAPEYGVASSFQPLTEAPDGLGACLSRKG